MSLIELLRQWMDSEKKNMDYGDGFVVDIMKVME